MRKWINLVEEHTKSQYTYVGNCTNHHMAAGLEEMIDRSHEVSYDEMVSAVGTKQLATIFDEYDWSNNPRDLQMKNDYAVSYYKSTFENKPCYYVRFSGIEYVFVDLEYEPVTTDLRLIVTDDGQILKTGEGIPIFSIEKISPKTANITQTSRANSKSAKALLNWLSSQDIEVVIDDGDEKTVDEFVDWLNTFL